MEPLENDMLKYIGVSYQMLFLAVNLILMLNFVIAILSDTYSKLSGLKEGLYYNQLIKIFPSLDWDSKYGSLVCSNAPFNLFMIPIVPFMMYYENNEPTLILINEFACYILYLPVAFSMSVIFGVINIFLAPIAYFYNVV